MNLVRTDPSAKFICCCWRNLWCDCNVTHTHRNATSQPKYWQIIKCRLTIRIVSLFSMCRLRITTQLRSDAVDKMAGIFTKRIWQPGICEPSDLKTKKKSAGPNKNLGGPWPTQAALRIATASDYHGTRNSNYRRNNSNRNALRLRNTCRVSTS